MGSYLIHKPAKLIGFLGPMQSGKTTCARFLEEDFGFTRHRLAAPIKNMVKCLGLSDDQVDGELKTEPTSLLCGKSPRQALQTLGTEWGRNLIGEDLWLRAWAHTMPATPSGRIVCDDVRFPNEHLAIKALGGLLIRVSRPGYEHSGSHQSEKHELECDHVVFNYGGLDSLRMRLGLLLNEVEPKW